MAKKPDPDPHWVLGSVHRITVVVCAPGHPPKYWNIDPEDVNRHLDLSSSREDAVERAVTEALWRGVFLQNRESEKP